MKSAARRLGKTLDQRGASAVRVAREARAIRGLQWITGRAVEHEGLRARRGMRANLAAVEPDVVLLRHLEAELGDAAIDGDALRADPLFDGTARAQPALREIFLQPLGPVSSACAGRQTWHG